VITPYPAMLLQQADDKSPLLLALANGIVATTLWLVTIFALPASAQTSSGFTLWQGSSILPDDRLFSLPSEWQTVPSESLDADLWLRWQDHGLVFEGALLGQQTQPDGSTLQRARINELYTDFSAYGLEFTLGKKVIGTGIGYGYRPLDLIQGENRRSLNNTRLQGVPLLRIESIDADSALSLTWFNQLQVDEHGIEPDDQQLLLRHYRYWGDVETEWLLYHHQQLGAALGGGFTRVSGDALEWHGALLLRERLSRPSLALPAGSDPLASAPPWGSETIHGDGSALLGLSWSHASGFSLIAEWWHDASALSRDDWKRLFELGAAQRALLGLAADKTVYGNLAWDSQAFQPHALLQENMMLHLSWDNDRIDPAFDLLVTPQDQGYVATLSAAWEIRQGLELSGGVRMFGGPDDSAYAQLPISTTGYLQLRGEMLW
jgi:hypothetical protein